MRQAKARLTSTPGAITNGNDLVAAYIRQSKHFPSPVAEVACKMADVGDRAQGYSQGPTAFTLGFVWLLLKAWFLGIGKWNRHQD